MHIVKAHGLGNDFLLLEAGAASPEKVRRLCERHVGLGADGLIAYQRARDEDGLVMRLFNTDGGEVEISANGLRCLAAHGFRTGLVPRRHTVETGAGPREVEVKPLGPAEYRVTCDLGCPILDSRDVPMALSPPRAPVVNEPLEVGGEMLEVTVTSVGNPHCTLFRDAPASDALVKHLGPLLENHPLFPRRTNVEFATVVSESELRVRFWERGVGLTRSSGTGAAGATLAAHLTGRAGREVRVVCDGGTLDVTWAADGKLWQTGIVEILYVGDWLPVLGEAVAEAHDRV